MACTTASISLVKVSILKYYHKINYFNNINFTNILVYKFKMSNSDCNQAIINMTVIIALFYIGYYCQIDNFLIPFFTN